MLQTNQQTISEFIEVLLQLEHEVYVFPCPEISNASIGQHTRHIIELYQALLSGYETGIVCYDQRKRDKEIENNSSHAVNILNKISNEILLTDKKLMVEYELNGETFQLESNYFRELMYNLEHMIHHQALIKVALNQLSNMNLNESFGVAPSTLQYRNQCAQ